MPLPAILGTIAGLGLEYGPAAIGALNSIINPVTQGQSIINPVTQGQRIVTRKPYVARKRPTKRRRVVRTQTRKKKLYY